MKTIPVYSHLNIAVPPAERDAFLHATAMHAPPNWSYDSQESEDFARRMGSSEKAACFFQSGNVIGIPCSATIYEDSEGFYLANINPAEVGYISMEQYNTLLSSLVENVVYPAVAGKGWRVVITAPRQSPEDWYGAQVAKSLQTFSGLANKSSGGSLPLDEERFQEFIVTAHNHGVRSVDDSLARWLHEAERWDEEDAQRLATRFRQGLDLLSRKETFRH